MAYREKHKRWQRIKQSIKTIKIIMAKKNVVSPNPILNDLLYTILYCASYKEKRGLPEKMVKATMTETTAKRYIAQMTDEERKILLSHFGYRHFWGFIKSDFKKDDIGAIIEDFEKDNKASALKKMIDLGLYIMSDKEFIRLFSFTSRSIHQNSFFLDLEYKRQGFNLKKWKRRSFIERDMLVREIDESSVELSKLFMVSFAIMGTCKERFDVSYNDMIVLFFLYTKPQTAFSEQKLIELFLWFMTKAATRRSIQYLRKKKMIEVDKIDNETLYTISGSGTKVVAEFFKTIFDKLDGK